MKRAMPEHTLSHSAILPFKLMPVRHRIAITTIAINVRLSIISLLPDSFTLIFRYATCIIFFLFFFIKILSLFFSG
jgi:hypothetical protein